MSGKAYIPSEIDICIGKTIQILRARMGMTQKDLAAATGVTFQQIQKYESADNRVSASTLYRIARVLTVPVSALYNEVGTAYAHDKHMMDLIQKIYKMTDADKKLVTNIVYRLGA